jgi:hypothetical protein
MSLYLDHVDELTPEIVTARATELRQACHGSPAEQPRYEATVRDTYAKRAAVRALQKVPTSAYIESVDGDAARAAAMHIYTDTLAWHVAAPDEVADACAEIAYGWRRAVIEAACDSERAAGGKLDVLLHYLIQQWADLNAEDEMLTLVQQLAAWREGRDATVTSVLIAHDAMVTMQAAAK